MDYSDYRWFNGEIEPLDNIKSQEKRIEFLEERRSRVRGLGASKEMLDEFDRLIRVEMEKGASSNHTRDQKQEYKDLSDMMNNLDNKITQIEDSILNDKNSSSDEPEKKAIYLHEIITSKYADEIAEAMKVEYKNIKGKRLRILLMALQSTSLIPNDRIDKSFHVACKNSFEWDIKGYSAMEKRKFIKGSTTTDGKEHESEDEKELEKMICYFEELKIKLSKKDSN